MTTTKDGIKFTNSGQIILLMLLCLWFILPLVVWLLLLGVYCFSYEDKKGIAPLQWLVVFSFSFLISSRYIGLLWDGVDDMPSYFLAYLNYDEFKWIFQTSIKFAHHGDFLFGFYSWFIAQISDHDLFVYYFTTVFITYLFMWAFLKKVAAPKLVLCFLFTAMFFKYFQFQWHLIRSCMAVPLLLLGLVYLGENTKKGAGIFLIGGLVHFSTFALTLPLILIGKRLEKNWGIKGLLIFSLVLIGSVTVLIFSAGLLSSFSGIYVISKIVSRLHIEPGFAMFPFWLFFFLVFVFTLPAYLKSSDSNYIKLFNISFYFLIIGAISLIVAGKELYRFIMPLFLIYSPLIFKTVKYYRQRFVINFVLVALFCIHLLSFTYVLWLNESDFFYLVSDKHPITQSGWNYLTGFFSYLADDIDFYSGYRQ